MSVLDDAISNMMCAFSKVGVMYSMPLEPKTESDKQAVLMDMHKYFRECLIPYMNKGFPPGNWYLITITSEKASATRDDVIHYFDEFVSYLAGKGTVQHAVVERSSIWHVHALVNLKKYAKNLQRDLTAHLGVRVHVARKATNAKLFNGLCKYILKREYEEKGGTYDSTLLIGITYAKGQGYSLVHPHPPPDNGIIYSPPTPPAGGNTPSLEGGG